MAADTFTTEDADLLRVRSGFSLANVDPDSTPGYDGDKDDASRYFMADDNEVDELQERLYANARVGNIHVPTVLLVLQGMDTAGKGGVIRHVVRGIDPQSVHIASFKAPTEIERQHDFLWRVEKEVPQRGTIGVFDRSHYEDVLIQRVRQFAPPEEIERRYGAIVDFENELATHGVHVIKVMLHISKDEQRERLEERLQRPDKYWKFNPGDIDERELWDDYMEAYEIALNRTATVTSPWYCVPANKKWYSRMVVKRLLLDKLRSFNLAWPPATFDPQEQLERLRQS